MSSPEREEVARQLAESLNFHVTRQGTWINDDQRPQSVQTLPAHVRDALISREMRVRQLEQALRFIHDTFDKDLQQGFHTNDKAFARDIAGSALNSKGEKPT